VDTDRDGQLNVDEFEHAMRALSTQAFGRAVVMLVFVAVWPLLVGLGYGAATELAKQHRIGQHLPAGIFCGAGLIDDLHLLPTVLTILGFIFVVPHVIAVVDRISALLFGTQRAWAMPRRRATTDGQPAAPVSDDWVEIKLRVPRWLAAWTNRRAPEAIDPSPLLRAT
jgi:hypothetical protein